MEVHDQEIRCSSCEGYKQALESHEGLMDYVVLALSKTMDRQEWRIKKLTEELEKLKNQPPRSEDDETSYTEEYSQGYGGTD